jgi:LPS-assembly lipoprotein
LRQARRPGQAIWRFLQEFEDILFKIDSNSHDLGILAFTLLSYLIEQWNLPAARRTPSGPEFHDHNLFAFQGGGGGGSPTHALKIRVTPSRSTTSVDLQTGRSDTDIYSLTATYDLTDLRTGKVVLRDKAFAPVSYDTPGEQQRFARARALRDAEDRAAQFVADTIKGRLSSFFVAGS